MKETQIYDAGIDQYRSVTGIEMLDSDTTLEGAHKFFPGNSNTFRIQGFSFELPKDFQFDATSLNEAIAFFKKEGKSTRIIAFGVVHRVESVMNFSQM